MAHLHAVAPPRRARAQSFALLLRVTSASRGGQRRPTSVYMPVELLHLKQAVLPQCEIPLSQEGKRFLGQDELLR